MPSKDEKIFVTRPNLPPLEEFLPYLEKVWESRFLTNNGPFHRQFEAELSRFLGVDYLSLFANGTLALVTALQALRITGEVITTPYSFVATAHALYWNGIRPVFVDVEPDYLTIDPAKIEPAITPHTTAILGVHVYGNPCKMEQIQEIADTFGLHVIYDAAHAFGVTYKGQSVLRYGDLSILSFHATKVFTTFEGGAIIAQNEKLKERIDYLKNFGFANEVTVIGPGINAKMNEFQAALGLLQLKYVQQYIEQRKQISLRYQEIFEKIPGIRVLPHPGEIEYNFAYFPIFIDEKVYGTSRDAMYEILKQHNIYARRYFYPLITHFPPYRGYESARPEHLPVAEKVSREVLCLPLYADLKPEVVEQIGDIFKQHAP